MTQIIDHGRWVPYQPDTLPELAPPGAMFARRESDGVDWYEYVRDAKSFYVDTVKFTAIWQDVHDGYTIGAATCDPTRLFPAGALLREIVDYHGGEPQAELGGRLYRPDTNTLHDRPKPLSVPDTRDLEARIAALEAKIK